MSKQIEVEELPSEQPIRIQVDGTMVTIRLGGNGVHIKRDGHQWEFVSWSDILAKAEHQMKLL
jgi:hypothetical protein